MSKSPFQTDGSARLKKTLNTMELGHLVERTLREYGRVEVYRCRNGAVRIDAVSPHRVYPPAPGSGQKNASP